MIFAPFFSSPPYSYLPPFLLSPLFPPSIFPFSTLHLFLPLSSLLLYSSSFLSSATVSSPPPPPSLPPSLPPSAAWHDSFVRSSAAQVCGCRRTGYCTWPAVRYVNSHPFSFFSIWETTSVVNEVTSSPDRQLYIPSKGCGVKCIRWKRLQEHTHLHL